MKKKTRKQGFTLVEVMVVMAIVALLAATAIPKIKDIYEDAQLDKAEADAMQIVAAIQRVELKNELSNFTPVEVFDTDKVLLSADYDTLNLADIKSRYTFKFAIINKDEATEKRVIQVFRNQADSTNNSAPKKEVIIPE